MSDVKDTLSEMVIPESEKEIPDYYINSVKMLTSLYELMLTFGIKSDPNIDPKSLVVIRMSPQHAKVFSKILAKNITDYEKNLGEIKLPAELLKNLGIE